MEPNTTNPEQQIKDADERAEEAKASLMSRIEELGRRYNVAKHDIDIKAHITNHPWRAVGIAFAVGSLMAFGGRRPGRQRSGAPRRSMGGVVVTALGAIAMRAFKDVALRQVATMAKTWLRGNENENANHDAPASRDPSVEAFLKH